MPKPMTISIPHQLGRAEAKRRIQEGMGQARAQLGAVATSMEDSWSGDRMDFRVVALAQAVSGRIEVREDAIDMEVELPWALAMLAGKLKTRIQHQGTLMLEKK
ncbi:polyhydroxyalkanoic acid system family protein [Azospirillum sp. SYSU D00513]|uniref:polyhydroxyalkanoic acid system family protein n=1 Tax=Azospirillum sp. SYSU D00513 TaxID=2812561 RepID=UPI001A966C5B|nr:polyhydroxyalkanoic acid system family protein [Azospirillum sp. SYSU D00513]